MRDETKITLTFANKQEQKLVQFLKEQTQSKGIDAYIKEILTKEMNDLQLKERLKIKVKVIE